MRNEDGRDLEREQTSRNSLSEKRGVPGVKECTRCGEKQSDSNFYADRSKIDGRRNSCKDCDMQYYTGRKTKKISELLREWEAPKNDLHR